MAQYYAFKVDPDGKEPMGTFNRMLFELKTDKGAIRRAQRIYGTTCVVIRYTNFFNRDTYHTIYGCCPVRWLN